MRHHIDYALSERLRCSRGTYHEAPALALTAVDAVQAERIARLQSRYQAGFEQHLSAATSLNNYEYLDILDAAWSAWGLAPQGGGELCDVGSANFWYAPALQAFFRPERLLGVEIEGHRRYRDGHTRRDYAAGYLARWPNARLLIADYAGLEQPADFITAWFPFVTAPAILAWRLPLAMLAAESLLRRIRSNLRREGVFLMVNHGSAEAAVAARYCDAAGLRLLRDRRHAGPLSGHRLEPPIVSLWSA